VRSGPTGRRLWSLGTWLTRAVTRQDAASFERRVKLGAGSADRGIGCPGTRTGRDPLGMWTTPLLYERLTWPEVRRAAGEARVAIIPVATLEDHGPHLPVDCDLRITAEICRRAAEATPDQTVLLPAIPHGYDPHHMDFPGPITVGWDTFTKYCT